MKRDVLHRHGASCFVRRKRAESAVVNPKNPLEFRQAIGGCTALADFQAMRSDCLSPDFETKIEMVYDVRVVGHLLSSKSSTFAVLS